MREIRQAGPHEAHGFRAIERTDGNRNAEREPDVLIEWRRRR